MDRYKILHATTADKAPNEANCEEKSQRSRPATDNFVVFTHHNSQSMMCKCKIYRCMFPMSTGTHKPQTTNSFKAVGKHGVLVLCISLFRVSRSMYYYIQYETLHNKLATNTSIVRPRYAQKVPERKRLVLEGSRTVVVFTIRD